MITKPEFKDLNIKRFTSTKRTNPQKRRDYLMRAVDNWTVAGDYVIEWISKAILRNHPYDKINELALTLLMCAMDGNAPAPNIKVKIHDAQGE